MLAQVKWLDIEKFSPACDGKRLFKPRELVPAAGAACLDREVVAN